MGKRENEINKVDGGREYKWCQLWDRRIKYDTVEETDIIDDGEICENRK